MMVTVPRIAAVSYPDTIPFLYGIRHEGNFRADLVLSDPEDCIRIFNQGRADIALVPASVVPALAGAHPVTGYCIGAGNRAPAAVLAGREPVTEARRVLYDPARETEAQLAEYLFRTHWKRTPRWEVCAGTDAGAMLAGDFRLLTDLEAAAASARYAVVCDLAAEWRRATRLPFVFRVWAAREEIDPDWIEGLHGALTFGIEHAYEAVLDSSLSADPGAAYAYLTSFDHIFDNQKQKALQKFWNAGIKVALRANPG